MTEDNIPLPFVYALLSSKGSNIYVEPFRAMWDGDGHSQIGQCIPSRLVTHYRLQTPIEIDMYNFSVVGQKMMGMRNGHIAQDVQDWKRNLVDHIFDSAWIVRITRITVNIRGRGTNIGQFGACNSAS